MIYLIDVNKNKLFSFKTEILARQFSDQYNNPEHLISPDVYYFDGAGTNGILSRICFGKKDNFKIMHKGAYVTNNQAEYMALIECLKLSNKYSVLIGDSKLVINQVLGIFKVNYGHLSLLKDEAKKILDEKKCHLVWKYRNENEAGVYLEKNKGK